MSLSNSNTGMPPSSLGISPNRPRAYWYYQSKDPNAPGWIPISDFASETIEDDYKKNMNKNGFGNRVHHINGEGSSQINFVTMESRCFSWKCEEFLHASNRVGKPELEKGHPFHGRTPIPDDHTDFKLKREFY